MGVEMDRVGLVTLHGQNYGSVLQCYATKRYIESFGYGCDVLNMAPRGYEAVMAKAKSLLRTAVACAFHPTYLSARLEVARAAKVAHEAISEKSREQLDLFEQSVLQPKDVSWALLKDSHFTEAYEWYITGSDQVWSAALLASPFMLLDFAEPERRIALSASFGMDTLKSFNKRHFARSISQFKHLSVRERSGCKMIKTATGRDVPVLADPVMLLSRREWTSFARGGVGDGHPPYILAHFLDRLSDVAVETIGLLSERLGLPVVVFAYPRDELGCLGGAEFVDGSPEDYVSLISHAEFVCTDSFHSVQFSILFNAKFLVFERMYEHRNHQGSRIETVLATYDCSNRFVRFPPTAVDDIIADESSFDVRRREERRRITSYIDGILNCGSSASVKDVGLSSVGRRDPVLKTPVDCVGCMACMAVCPMGAIHPDLCLLGQRVPRIDAAACIKCGSCERVCRGSGRERIHSEEASSVHAYISYSLDSNLSSRAASSGTFATIADAFLRAGGAVVGSRLEFFEGRPTCEHVLVTQRESLAQLLGSKYVESDCAGAMPSVADRLKDGQPVLFCGTSCQVAGLSRYLEERRVSKEGLYTIDLICHGVPGIGLFSDYVRWLGNKHGGDVTSFSFRDKTGLGVTYVESATIQRGEVARTLKIPPEESSYYSMFMAFENYREACYHCPYASLDKPADITVGDYFEARDDYPEMFEVGGTFHGVQVINSIISRSWKGQELLGRYGKTLVKQEVDPKVVQKSHRQLCRPGNYSTMRLRAIEQWGKGGVPRMQSMHIRRVRVKKVLRTLLIPAYTSRNLLRVIWRGILS